MEPPQARDRLQSQSPQQQRLLALAGQAPRRNRCRPDFEAAGCLFLGWGFFPIGQRTARLLPERWPTDPLPLTVMVVSYPVKVTGVRTAHAKVRGATLLLLQRLLSPSVRPGAA